MGNKQYLGSKRHGHAWRLRAGGLSETFYAPRGDAKGTKAAAAALRDLENRAAKEASRVHHTVGELWERWIDMCEWRGLSPTTLRDYRNVWKFTLNDNFGSKPVDKVTSQDLDAFYQMHLDEGRKPITVHKYHRILASLFRQAVRWEWIEYPPTKNATPPRVVRRKIKLPELTIIKTLVEACDDDEMRLLILLAAALGARRGELLALQWEDVQDGTVSISKSMYDRVGGGVGIKETKTGTTRRVTLDGRARLALEAIRKPSGPIFSHRPDVVTHKFINLRNSVLGAETLRFHDLRHWHASYLIAMGHDPVMVSERLGHSNVSTTLNVYAHAMEQRDREAAAAIGAVL